MKILEVMAFLSPEFGGSAKMPYRLSKELAKRGHEVTIYTSDAKLTKEYMASIPEVTVRAFKSWFSVAELFVTPSIINTAKNEIGQFDVIHMQNYRTLQNVVAHHYAKKYNVPYVLEANGSLTTFFQRGTLKRIFDVVFGNSILRDASRAIVGGEMEVDEHRKMGFSEDRITLIPPAYDIEEFSQIPDDGKFKDKFRVGLGGKHMILFMGRIHKIKGIEFLIRAFYKLTKELDDVALVIAGPDSDYGNYLREIVRNLGIPNKVLFTGYLAGEDRLSALADADILVQTSVYERGVGTPFEAVLCGTPIIVTKGTGAGEMVKSIDAGYLVEYGNVKELTATMRKILDNPAEALDKAQKAKHYIMENLSWEKAVCLYENVYRSVIEGKSVERQGITR